MPSFVPTPTRSGWESAPPPPPRKTARRSPWTTSAGKTCCPAPYDPFARIVDMERDGVEAELLYTTFGLILFAIKDQDFQFACFQAFNDWLANFCASFPNRLFGAAMIPTEPIARGVREMERCAKMGLKAAMISISQDADSRL